jgi:hypothetical protein
MVMVSCPLNLWWCPASSKNRGMVRENRDRVGEERQPRESRGRETTEKERTVRREKPGEWGEWGDFRNWMRGMRGEFEKPNERNRLRGAWETEWEKRIDRGMRNQMRWEWDGNDSGMKPNEMGMRWEWQWNETEWEEKPNDDEMMSLISYGRELEIGEREQRKQWGFFIKAVVVCSCGCSRTPHTSCELIILYL